ncbi:MAG TPA: divalent metal cation transporter, partial [Sphingomicrobium sp.]|nr:divalent metal cation transporter [Sphingomicrobium sp.]
MARSLDPDSAAKPRSDLPGRQRRLDWRRVIGPGLITGASDDDPSGIATYSQVGAQFGYGLGWTMILTYPLMSAVQMVSARIGRVTGHGIAGNLARHYPAWLTNGIVLLLLIANTINIGANLGAMADATALVTGLPPAGFLLVFAAFCAAAEVLLRYQSYARVLKWLTLALLSYVVTLFLVRIPWQEAARGLVFPDVEWDRETLLMIVAIFGTTISPYLFFWQASQEAEEVQVAPDAKPLKRDPLEGRVELRRIGYDTLLGMAASNLVALAIILTCAATLNANGVLDIRTSADAAAALEPFAGTYASVVFALGIVGTGLLAVPVLAGSAAYAVGEALRWPVGLDRKPRRAKAFYATIVAATAIGAVMNFSPIDPMRALVLAAVINGVVSVPVMTVMMLMATRKPLMGVFTVNGPLLWLGWLATAVMGAAVIAMIAAYL